MDREVKSSAWTKELLQMLNETLHFNPEKRISVQGAIELPSASVSVLALCRRTQFPPQQEAV